MNWSGFTPKDFEYDFERDKLFEHRVTFDEVIEWVASLPVGRYDDRE